MIRAIIILGLFAVSFSAMAQEKSPVKQNDLKGPEYKNYQFWRHNVAPTKIQAAATVETVQGPEYKNRRPAATSKGEQVLVTFGSERNKLQGPAFKNYKF